MIPVREDPQRAALRGGSFLDIQGFALVRHISAVVNFYNDQLVREVYYPEVEALLKRRTGAVRVVIFDHTVRNADKAARHEDNAREYGRLVHNDYSLRLGARRVRDHVPDQAEELASASLRRDQRMASDSRPDPINPAGHMRCAQH